MRCIIPQTYNDVGWERWAYKLPYKYSEVIRLLYYLPIERMKIEIEKSEYDRLKSREEKLMAYYEWFVDKENDLATVEDIINENIELRDTIEDIYKENRKLLGDKVRLKTLSNHKTDVITWLWKNLDEFREENKKLKEYNWELIENHKKDIDVLCKENEKLKEKIERLEFDVDAWHQLKLLLEWEIEKLKETIKDHQLYEEKLEHRIIEFEELLHWE